MRAICGLALTLLVLALAGEALAAARPAAGTRFVGKTSQGKRILLRMTSGGGLRMDFDLIARCNRGPDRSTHATFHRDKPHVRRNGTFDYRATYRDLDPVPGLPERFDDLQHITGAFGDGRVTGTFDETVRGRKTGLRCTTHLTFVAHRSG